VEKMARGHRRRRCSSSSSCGQVSQPARAAGVEGVSDHPLRRTMQNGAPGNQRRLSDSQRKPRAFLYSRMMWMSAALPSFSMYQYQNPTELMSN